MKQSHFYLVISTFFLFITATGCIMSAPAATITGIPIPTITQTVTTTQTRSPTEIPPELSFPTNTPSPTPTPIIPDTGWEIIRSGLERRRINLFDDSGQHLEALYILRIDPGIYQFKVAYQAQPMTLLDWHLTTNALILVNGGYYRLDEDTYIPTGLTIVDGEVIGNSFGDFAGMLAITDSGPELRWMALKPYSPGEPIRYGLQSFPILIKPGGEMGFSAQYEDNIQARRTVVGQDQDGRILLLVASRGAFTLHQLSLYLYESDFDLDIAINLDGGPSSGILLAEPYEEIPPFSLLPVVITVHERE
jgi:exopolysaccharide biosynthesis protein